jgi:hypothetical protein
MEFSQLTHMQFPTVVLCCWTMLPHMLSLTPTSDPLANAGTRPLLPRCAYALTLPLTTERRNSKCGYTSIATSVVGVRDDHFLHRTLSDGRMGD